MVKMQYVANHVITLCISDRLLNFVLLVGTGMTRHDREEGRRVEEILSRDRGGYVV